MNHFGKKAKGLFIVVCVALLVFTFTACSQKDSTTQDNQGTKLSESEEKDKNTEVSGDKEGDDGKKFFRLFKNRFLVSGDKESDDEKKDEDGKNVTATSVPMEDENNEDLVLNWTIELTYKDNYQFIGGVAIGFFNRNDEDVGTIEVDVVDGVLTIPEEVNGQPVIHLAESAILEIKRKFAIKEIVIPASVIKIDQKAFDAVVCRSLELFKVAEGNSNYYSKDGVIYEIDHKNMDHILLVHYPFGKTDESFTVPGDIYGIYEWAFCENKYIKEIVISDGVEGIMGDAFHDCYALERVSIPASVTSVGIYGTSVNIFEGCYSLKQIDVDDENKTLFDDGGVLYRGETLICYPAGKTDVEYVVREGTVAIGEHAIYKNASLEKVTCPKGLMEIYAYAFASCDSLKTIVIDLGENSYDSIYKGHRVFLGTEDNKGFSVCDTNGNILYTPN